MPSKKPNAKRIPAKAKELRQERAEYHARTCRAMWPMLAANMRFAPNGYVRQSIRKLDGRYRRLFGEPSRAQKVLSKYVLYRAHVGKLHEVIRPRALHPRVEAPKVYHYPNDHELVGDECPYTVTHPHFNAGYAANRVVQTGRRMVLGATLALVGGGKRTHNPLDNRAGKADEKYRPKDDLEKLAAPVEGL